MVRECRPPEREPPGSWLARRSTIATSIPARAKLARQHQACRTYSDNHHRKLGHRHTPSPSSRRATPAQPIPQPSHHRFDVPARPIRRQQHTHLVPSIPQVLLLRPAIMQHDPGLAASPPVRSILRVESEWVLSLPFFVRCGRTPSSRSGGAPRTAVPSAQNSCHGPNRWGRSRHATSVR
jgi:hypothetical protein